MGDEMIQTQGAVGPQETAAASAQVPKSNSSKTLIIGLFVALVVVLGIIAVYATTQGTTTPAQLPSQSVAQPPFAVATLEDEINSVTIEDIESDFSDIDRDLKSL